MAQVVHCILAKGRRDANKACNETLLITIKGLSLLGEADAGDVDAVCI